MYCINNSVNISPHLTNLLPNAQFWENLPLLLSRKLFLTSWLPRRPCFSHTTTGDYSVRSAEPRPEGTAPPVDPGTQAVLPNETPQLHSKTPLQYCRVLLAALGIPPVKKYSYQKVLGKRKKLTLDGPKTMKRLSHPSLHFNGSITSASCMFMSSIDWATKCSKRRFNGPPWLSKRLRSTLLSDSHIQREPSHMAIQLVHKLVTKLYRNK